MKINAKTKNKLKYVSIQHPLSEGTKSFIAARVLVESENIRLRGMGYFVIYSCFNKGFP